MTYDSIQEVYLMVSGTDTVFFDWPFPNDVLVHRTPPVFIGDKENFIKANLIYPAEAKKRKVEGYVNVDCTIDSNGVPLRIFVMYTTSPLFEKEAERIVSLMR